MAQLVVSVAGAALGSFFGPVGTQIGWALGSAIGAGLAPKQRIEGPRLSDLKVGASQYGQPIPVLWGAPRVAGQVWWASDKRAIATTTETGKGGGQEYTSYTYEIDLLLGLCDQQAEALSRVWINGKLVWTRLLGASDSTLAASDGSNLWRRLTFYGGGPTQLPDPTYEAAVGLGNAPAYRGRSTVFIEALQLGSSGQLPNITFEVAADGEYTVATPTAGPVQAANFYFGGTAAGASAKMRVPIGQWNASYATSEVRVYDFDLLAGTVQQVGSYNHAAGSMTVLPATGSSDVPLMAVVQGAQITTHEGATGATTAVFNLPASIGSSQARFARAGNDIVFGPSSGTTLQLYRYAVTGGTTPLATSAPLPSPVNSLLIVGSTVYAAYNNLKQIAVLDLATLTVQSTINRPTFGGPASDNWPWLFLFDGQLGLAGHRFAGGSTRAIYVWRSGAWDDLGNITPSFLADSNAAQSISVVGGLLVGGNMAPSPPYQYQPWAAKLVVEPGAQPIRDVVESICARAGMPAGTYDAAELAAITKPVRALAAADAGAARGLLQQLQTAFFFEASLSDKLRFRPRAAAAVATIPWEDLGAGVERPAEQPLPLTLASDLELPPRAAVTYANVNDDQQPGTEQSERIVSGQAAAINAITLAIGMTPAEAKGVAEAVVIDGAAALLTGTVELSTRYARLEAGDVVNVVDEDARTYRLRLVRQRLQSGVASFEAVGDDATALTSAGITDQTQVSGNEVTKAANTVLYGLDMPMLRDADDGPGYYVAARGDASGWPGAQALASPDNVTYSLAADITESAVLGTCSTTLAHYTGVGFDERNALTVNVGPGQLSSSTRDAMLLDESINAMLVGSEVIRFRTATLQSPGVYVLTGLLRGERGTEWAMAGHVASERCVLLRARGLRRVSTSTAEIGVQRWLKGVTLGAPTSSAQGAAFTDTGISLKPWSVVNLRQVQGAAGPELTWERRTRYRPSYGGPAGVSIPLGEESEAYDVELRDTGSALVATYRTTQPRLELSGATFSATWAKGVAYPHEHGGALFGLLIDDPNDVRLVKQDAGTRTVVLTSPKQGGYRQGIAYSGSTAWLAVLETLSQPGQPDIPIGAFLRRFDLGGTLAAPTASWSPTLSDDLSDVSFDGTDVWTVSYYGKLRRHNASTLAVLNEYTIPYAARAVSASAGSVIVATARQYNTATQLTSTAAVRAYDGAGVEQWAVTFGTSLLNTTGAAGVPGPMVCTATLIFVALVTDGVAEVRVLNRSTGAAVATVATGGVLRALGANVANVISTPATYKSITLQTLDGSSGAVISTVRSTGVEDVTGQVNAKAFGVRTDTVFPNIDFRGYELTLQPNLAGFTATVYQVSATVGRGYATSITL